MSVHLTKEDKIKFREECKKLSPNELLELAGFIEQSHAFSESDLRFMHSCIGQRCERLLRNVVQRFSFEDA